MNQDRIKDTKEFKLVRCVKSTHNPPFFCSSAKELHRGEILLLRLPSSGL
jgi:hypothetical protein